MICFGAHHGEYCEKILQRCFECHVVAKKEVDHAKGCGARTWFRSEMYVDMYVKMSAVRATIDFGKPIFYELNGGFVKAKPEAELFSGMADIHFKFVSESKIELKTTGFTRIRLPIIVRDKDGGFIERLVIMTSHDRTIVAANSGRLVSQSNVLSGFEHNTPLLMCVQDGETTVSVGVHSGGTINTYEIHSIDGKFVIPNDLDVRAQKFVPKLFDAEFPTKKMKN